MTIKQLEFNTSYILYVQLQCHEYTIRWNIHRDKDPFRLKWIGGTNSRKHF